MGGPAASYPAPRCAASSGKSPSGAVALMLVIGGCGGDDDKGNGRKIQANETDLAFAAEMLDHHERGIDAAASPRAARATLWCAAPRET